MRWSVALMGFAVVSGCSDGGVGERSPGIDLAVRFGSHLPVTALEAEVPWGGPVTQSVLPHVGPPGDRTVSFALDIPAGSTSVPVTLRLTGRTAQGISVATGALTVEPDPGGRVPAEVTLAVIAPSSPTEWTRSWSWPSLEAESVAPVEVASVTLASDPEPRLIFLSGVLTGADESIVEVEVRLDGRVIDRFGHQVFGPPDDGGAGIFTFEVVPTATAAQTLSLRLGASVGAAAIRDVRVVAAGLPPGASLTSLSTDEDPERLGLGVLLDRLSVPSVAGGRYWVLAKMSLTEAPGTNTARGWLELPNGERRPLDERGVTFSSPRGALVPMMTQAVVDIPAGGADFALRGVSSGTGDGTLESWAEPDALFRHRLTLPGPVPDGYALSATFDHAEHVARGRAAPDGTDVVVVYRETPDATPVRIDRVLDPDSAWNRAQTTVWFRTQAAVDDLGSSQYEIYLGGIRNADEDPAQIFAFYDDFEAQALDLQRWNVIDGTGLSVVDGALRVQGAASLSTLLSVTPDGGRWEARLRMLDPTPDGLRYLVAGGENDPAGAAFEALETGHSAQAGAASEAVTVQTPTEVHTYAISRTDGQNVIFTQNGEALATLAGGPNQTELWPLRIENAGESGAVYEWVRVRPYVSPEPAVTVEGLEGGAGVVASTYRYRKIVAVGLDDGWADVRSAGSGPEAVRTTGPFTPVSTLDVPTAPGARLVVSSVRVAGANDVAARRRGVVRVNERSVLQTGHRINRDDSDRVGYHHVAGVAFAASGTVAQSLEVGVASPDGIEVSGVDGRIIVLEYPR